MQIVQQKVTFWGETPYNFEDSLKWIEKAGRVCYDSLDRMTDTSYESFVYGRVKDAHLSIIEHSNLVIRTISKNKFPTSMYDNFKEHCRSFNLRVHINNDYVYVAGNYRAFVEHLLCTLYDNDNIMLSVCHDVIRSIFTDVIEKSLYSFSEIVPCMVLTDSNEIPEILKRVTFEYQTDRAVTHELVRHRRASFSQRSQRYVKENNLQIIEPYWFTSCSDIQKDKTIALFNDIEDLYSDLIKGTDGVKLKAEQARAVLPNAISTIIIMTTSINNIKWVLKLRDHSAAYPPARKLAHDSKIILQENGYLL